VKLGCGGGNSALGVDTVDVKRKVLGAALTAGDAAALAGLSGGFVVEGTFDARRCCFAGVTPSIGVDVVDAHAFSFFSTAVLMSSLPGCCFFDGSGLFESTLLEFTASALVPPVGARF
jgi:hypothetical protein